MSSSNKSNLIVLFFQALAVIASPIATASEEHSVKDVPISQASSSLREFISPEAIRIKPGAATSQSITSTWTYTCQTGGASSKNFTWRAAINPATGSLQLVGLYDIDFFGQPAPYRNGGATVAFGHSSCELHKNLWCSYNYKGTTVLSVDQNGLHMGLMNDVVQRGFNPVVEEECHPIEHGIQDTCPAVKNPRACTITHVSADPLPR